jgi:hypothetical protein
MRITVHSNPPHSASGCEDETNLERLGGIKEFVSTIIRIREDRQGQPDHESSAASGLEE